jgi:hypothetical protein
MYSNNRGMMVGRASRGFFELDRRECTYERLLARDCPGMAGFGCVRYLLYRCKLLIRLVLEAIISR